MESIEIYVQFWELQIQIIFPLYVYDEVLAVGEEEDEIDRIYELLILQIDQM